MLQRGSCGEELKEGSLLKEELRISVRKCGRKIPYPGEELREGRRISLREE
jgi:hypothetical protein